VMSLEWGMGQVRVWGLEQVWVWNLGWVQVRDQVLGWSGRKELRHSDNSLAITQSGGDACVCGDACIPCIAFACTVNFQQICQCLHKPTKRQLHWQLLGPVLQTQA